MSQYCIFTYVTSEVLTFLKRSFQGKLELSEDYSPAIALSEEKTKLLTENWRHRKNKV